MFLDPVGISPIMDLRILIIEDCLDAANLLKDILEANMHHVCIAEDKASALSVISANSEEIDVVLLDLHIPPNKKDLADINCGLQILELFKREFPCIEVIVLTAFDDVDIAVKSIKLGAYDYLVKPPKVEILQNKLRKISNNIGHEKESLELKRKENYQHIIGNSKSIRNIINSIEKLADSDVYVLIEGETGTGKELIAKAIHERSSRRENPFVAINCAAIPSTLLESELFGHEKGAFTNACNQKIGCFEEASNGTLFLDEIGEMKPDLQAKLLRVLESKSIRRVGGNGEIGINTRIISATNKEINQFTKNGNLREDLYYRLNHYKIHLPPLKDRKTDIPLLAKYFLDHYCTKMNLTKKKLTSSAIEKLLNYIWPGNIRQLKKVIQISVLFNREKEILDASSLYIEKEQINLTRLNFNDLFYLPLKEARKEFEKIYKKHQISTSKPQSEAARKAEMDKSNFNKLIRKYDLD